MRLTGIGIENKKAFEHLLGKEVLADHDVVIGAIEDDEAAGVAAYSVMDNALMLDYIYVADKFRRKRIGTSLITEFIRETADSGAVALHVNYPESASDLHAFILSLGFRIFRDGEAYRVPARELLGSATLDKMLKTQAAGRAVSVSELTDKDRAAIKASLIKEELDETIIDDSALSPELSFAVMDPGTKQPAALILCEQGEGVIALQYLINFTSNARMTVDAMRALRDAARAAGLEDHNLLFVTMTDSMRKLVTSLVADKDSITPEGNVISGILMI